MSLKPVYIPKRKRQRTQEIFGRNDGDSDEDERPLTAPAMRTKQSTAVAMLRPRLPVVQPSKEEPQQEQRPEDFMDERDHNEWGGPTRVKADVEAASTSDVLLQSGALRVNSTIGERLLRKLGWREGTDSETITAYISDGKRKESEPPGVANGGALVSVQEQQQSILLSQKQLQKIVRRQTRVKIPEPWKGRAGLGYAALRDAPEFRAAERQRRADQDRRFDTYKVSDVLGPNHAKSGADRTTNGTQNDGYYESLEDFVGYRSTAGFALREDEDDAYDPNVGTTKSIHTLVSNKATPKTSIDMRGYEAMAYDHEDSDPDEKEPEITSNKVDLEALSGWAQGTTDTCGRTALPGFILGINSAPHKTIYQGPIVPKDWRISPHIFGANEHPSILQAIARAVQIEAVKEQRNIATQRALEAAKVSARRREGLFASVGASMKNRFAAEGSAPIEKAQTEPIKGEPWESITRSVHSFVPDLLLCKRLNVTPPQRDESSVAESPLLRTRDQAYFQDEILKVAAESKQATEQANEEEDDDESEPARPDLSVYKAIFDPVDNDESTDLSDTEEAEYLQEPKQESTVEPKKEPRTETEMQDTIIPPKCNPNDAVKDEMPTEAERQMLSIATGTSIVACDDGQSGASSSCDDESRKKKKRKRRSKKEDKRSSKKRKKRKEKKKRHRKTEDAS